MERLKTFTTGQIAKEIARTVRGESDAPGRWRYPLDEWVVAQVVWAGQKIREEAGTYARRPGIPVNYDPNQFVRIFDILERKAVENSRRGLHFRRMGIGHRQLGTASSRLLSEPH